MSASVAMNSPTSERRAEAKRLPGSSATTVHADVWHRCFDLVGKSRSSLSRFFYSLLSTCAHVERAPDWKTWPMPLPFPEVHRKKANRAQHDISRKLGTNFVVLVMNWLHVGGEKGFCFSNIGMGTKLNRRQWEAVKRLATLVDGWNSQQLVSCDDMGRSASKVESIEIVLEELALKLKRLSQPLQPYSSGSAGFNLAGPGKYGHPGEVIGSLSAAVEHVAKEVEPGRLKFHKVPSFNPVAYLDDANRARFERPLDFACNPADATTPIPSVQLRCKPDRLVALLEKLDECDRLCLLPPSEVRQGLQCGLFCIPKDVLRDRLIIDARPSNCCEESEQRWVKSLGSFQQFQHIFLRSNQSLVMHCEDIREYYHAFKIGQQRRSRNSLKMQVSPQQVSHLRCYREELENEEYLTPALATMAMGDTNSVAFGQTAHISLLLRTGEFNIEDFLTLLQRPSRRSWHAGVMIDDFILVEAVDDYVAGSSTEGFSKVLAVREAYEVAGLPRHEGKSISAELKAEFWGAQVDGEKGEARPSLKRLIPLAHIILQVVALRHCSVAMLEILAGSLVSAFQLRRRLLSILQEVYVAQRGRERHDIVRLSPHLLDELLAAVALLAVTVVDFRLEPSGRLIASDASQHAEAAVDTWVGPTFTMEAQRHALQKGLWNRLMSPSDAFLREQGRLDDEEGLPEGNFDMHPLWREVVETMPFKQFGAVVKRRRRRHINLNEIDAALRAEKRLGDLEPSSFYIHLQDSQVSLACLVKGRSSSTEINRLLQRSIPDHVSANVRPYHGYVRSKLNPADDPTREASVRKASRVSNEWLVSVIAGDFGLLDAELDRWGLSIRHLGGLPDERELLPDGEVDRRTSVQKKIERGKLIGKFHTAGPCSEKLVCASFQGERGQSASAPLCGGSCKLVPSGKNEQETSREHQEAVEPDKTAIRGKRSSVEPSKAVASQSEESRVAPPALKQDAAVKASVNTEQFSALLDGESTDWKTFLLKAFHRDQFVHSRRFKSLEEAIASGPGILDLFSGARGFSRAFIRDPSSWSLCFDIKHRSTEDLLDPWLQSVLRKLLHLGRLEPWLHLLYALLLAQQ